MPRPVARVRSLSHRLADGNGTLSSNPTPFGAFGTIGGGQVIGCRADAKPRTQLHRLIEVQSDGPIPIDDKLIVADLPTQRIVRSFRPCGNVTLQARLHREAGEPRCTATSRSGWKVARCRTTSFLPHRQRQWLAGADGRHLAFRNLTGRNDKRRHRRPRAPDREWLRRKAAALQFTARDVPLADELRQRCPGPQRLGPTCGPAATSTISWWASTTRPRARSVDRRGWREWQPAGAEGRTISLEPACSLRLDNLDRWIPVSRRANAAHPTAGRAWPIEPVGRGNVRCFLKGAAGWI
jgi:hypothetical protein